MVKSSGAYKEIIAEIVDGQDSMGRPKLQVRPVAGQGLDTSLNIECSRRLRDAHPVGTKVQLQVQLTSMQGAPFLYSYHGWPVVILPSHTHK
jgi:hypothetical protein